jgi:hypothetical protein
MLGVVAALLLPSVVLCAQQALGGGPPNREKAREQAVERAKTALSEKLQVPVAKLSLESATEATWPNTALGCPEKDQMYAQVITEGWTVVLKADGKTHEVHVSGRRAVICPPKPVEGGLPACGGVPGA